MSAAMRAERVSVLSCALVCLLALCLLAAPAWALRVESDSAVSEQSLEQNVVADAFLQMEAGAEALTTAAKKCSIKFKTARAKTLYCKKHKASICCKKAAKKKAPVPHPAPKPSPAPHGSPSGALSGQHMPGNNVPGWKLIWAEDFNKASPEGHFPTDYKDRFNFYWGGHDTHKHGVYGPDKVISAHDGLLDVHMRTIDGTPNVAALLPLSPTQHGSTANYLGSLQYGRYAVRFKADQAHGFKTAWLLWPDSEKWPQDGEIDFPEGDLNSGFSGYMHCANNDQTQQDAIMNEKTNPWSNLATFKDWHTTVTEWSPGKVKFYLDGKLVGTSTRMVPHNPMHYVLQSESSEAGPKPTDAAHIYVDWLAIYAYDP